MTYMPRGQWDWYRKEAYSRDIATRERGLTAGGWAWVVRRGLGLDLRRGEGCLVRPDPGSVKPPNIVMVVLTVLTVPRGNFEATTLGVTGTSESKSESSDAVYRRPMSIAS